ncbi:MAG: ArnT family glycosyltransferase [Alphaproteobacteria bacterium]
MENLRLDSKRLGLYLLDITLILVVCLLLFFRGIGDKPFYDKQEAREALVIWEIHNSGNWILPLRNGDEIPAKPPFYHWLGALISMTAGRVDELTSRLPSAVLGTMGVLLTYATGVILWGRGAGLLSALVLSTSVEWRAARAARVDMALTFVLLCAFLFFLYLYRTGGGRKKAIVLGILLGLAMLAKGPLGLVVPCFTFFTFLLINRDLAFLKRLHPFTVASVCAVVAGSWYLLAFGQGGKEFLAMVIKENFGSVVGREAGHSHPFWWYIPYLFQNMAPWSLFFPTLGLFVYRYRQKLAKGELLYIVVWLSTVIIFFSIFSQKRTVYIISAYPAIALLFGAWWHKLKNEALPESHFITRLAAYLTAGVFLILSVLLMLQFSNHRPLDYLVPLLDEKDRMDLLRVAALLTKHRFASLAWSALCGLGGVFLILAAQRNAWGGFLACTAAMMALSLNNVQSFDTELAKEYTLKPFMSRVVSIVKDAPLFYYDAKDYSVIFYAGRHIHQYEPSASHVPSLFYVLFWESEWRKMRTTEGLVVQAKSEGIDRESTREGHLLLVAVTDPHPLASAGGSLVPAVKPLSGEQTD